MIDTLIDKQDTFEIIRDRIAQILADETASQQALASAAGKEPNLWKFRVFLERANPFEVFLVDTGDGFDRSPIVNVWYETSSYNESASNVVERQQSETIYNIDCYGYGVTEMTEEGHSPGDENAALNMQRAIRLVRNILMAATYTYLDTPVGSLERVWQRWIQSITSFQPTLGGTPVEKVIGSRIAFRVKFNEFSPQVRPETLELLTVDIKYDAQGAVIAQTAFDYT